MSTDPFTIVRATAADTDRVVPLFDGYRQFYGQASDVERARSFVRQRLAANDSVIYMALARDQVLGFTQLYPSFTSVHTQHIWILNDLFVLPTARHLGVGAALMQRARQHALDSGARGLVLETGVDNEAAQKLYERLGWKRDDAFYRYGLVVGGTE